ncbi:MAG: response regulator [Alphaproteobacteria bacterium]|jgi:CheY-like chemotaxis protein|nr:response regulator [Alphaproteobacteria bacterium]QQS56905.1 MAG: response regulator [Alphaproteobacteria bacterium]
MLNRLNVLIVDDEPDIATLIEFNLRRMLKAEDLNIVVANNANEALGAIQHNGHPPYDIILSDYNMPPGMNGSEMTAAIRSEHGHLSTPVILLTAGFDFQGIKQQALQNGVTEVLPKPFQLKDFKAALERNLPEGAFTTSTPQPHETSSQPNEERPHTIPALAI